MKVFVVCFNSGFDLEMYQKLVINILIIIQLQMIKQKALMIQIIFWKASLSIATCESIVDITEMCSFRIIWMNLIIQM